MNITGVKRSFNSIDDSGLPNSKRVKMEKSSAKTEELGKENLGSRPMEIENVSSNLMTREILATATEKDNVAPDGLESHVQDKKALSLEEYTALFFEEKLTIKDYEFLGKLLVSSPEIQNKMNRRLKFNIITRATRLKNCQNEKDLKCFLKIFYEFNFRKSPEVVAHYFYLVFGTDLYKFMEEDFIIHVLNTNVTQIDSKIFETCIGKLYRHRNSFYWTLIETKLIDEAFAKLTTLYKQLTPRDFHKSLEKLRTNRPKIWSQYLSLLPTESAAKLQ